MNKQWWMKLWVVVAISLAGLTSPTAQAQFNSDAPAFGQADPFAQPDFLPVTEAFRFDFRERGNTLTIRFDITDDYYLYQHRFKFEPESLLAEAVTLPPGVDHYDEFFGNSVVYRGQVEVSIPLVSERAGQQLTIHYQGCADAGLCYPPETHNISFAGGAASASVATPDTFNQVQAASQQLTNPFVAQLQQQALPLTLLIFLALGIGLAFTPCVFPMYPIISTIIMGQQRQASDGRLRWPRAFALAASYVLGMAITYTLLGIVVALAGLQYQAALQHPFILALLALVFVLFAGSLFGWYDLRLPSGLQQRIDALANRQQGGALGGVMVMGALSGLVVSPCTTAPLSGILLFIAQSGDVALGGLALFTLSIGMGIPLIIVAIGGGRWLPQSGPWLNTVKHIFAWLLIAVAVFMVERLVSVQLGSYLWLAYFIVAGVMLLHVLLQQLRGWRATLGACIIFIGIAAGFAWQLPWLINSQQHAPLQTVSTTAVATEVQQANSWTMVDLYADWCVACKEFERYTFTDTQVQQLLQTGQALQVDLTDNTPANRQFMQDYQVLGLPSILFFDANGNELTGLRVTGFMNAEEFAAHLRQVAQAAGTKAAPTPALVVTD